MTAVLLTALSGLCLALLVSGLSRRSGIYQYEFLAASTFIGFILIPSFGLSNATELPRGALDKTILMAIFCLLMVYVGERVGRKPFRVMQWQFSERRLLAAAAVLSFVGAFFFFQISRLDPELTSVGQWTGLPVAYRFFAQLLTYGFAIAALHYAATVSLPALAIMAFGMIFYVDRILVGARRGATAELAAIVALAFFFRRGWKIPRTLAVVAIALGTLFVWSTGDYRSELREGGSLEAIASIPFKENLARLFREGSEELRNAVYEIEATDRLFDFDFGASQWNSLVFSYVPAQLVGADLKESLMIPLGDSAAYRVLGHEAWTGTTRTGMSDAFASFWYFGAVNFFLIAYVLGRIFRAAIQGSAAMQLIYMLMIVNGLHAITHSTSWFVFPWAHLGAFLVPALWFARVKRGGAPVANGRGSIEARTLG